MSPKGNLAGARSNSRPWRRLHLTMVMAMALAATPMVLSNVMDKGDPALIRVSDGQRIEEQNWAQMATGQSMFAFEYGWPQSWVWMDASMPGPSFARGSSLVRYRA